MTKISIRFSTLIFAGVAAFALISLTGCSSDERHSSSYDSSSATMTTDSKDMSHIHHQDSH